MIKIYERKDSIRISENRFNIQSRWKESNENKYEFYFYDFTAVLEM
jgi:hypothetical protein